MKSTKTEQAEPDQLTRRGPIAMPIHLLPTRREFLARTTATGAGLALGVAGSPMHSRVILASEDSKPGYLAILSDTHINADRETTVKSPQSLHKMAENLEKVVRDLLGQPEPPLAVLMVGDLAHLVGDEGDYRLFLELIQPLQEAKLPLFLGLGNHDHREHFLGVLKPLALPGCEVEAKHVSVVSVPGLRLILLDSLNVPLEVKGLIGDAQHAWLAKTLDEKPDQPTVVLVHHNPKWPKAEATSALYDTDELLEVITPRKQVKGLIFGHTHTWNVREKDGIHHINLPGVGYPFAAGEPIGWCRLEPTARGMIAELHAIGGEVNKEPVRRELAWRSA